MSVRTLHSPLHGVVVFDVFNAKAENVLKAKMFESRVSASPKSSAHLSMVECRPSSSERPARRISSHGCRASCVYGSERDGRGGDQRAPIFVGIDRLLCLYSLSLSLLVPIFLCPSLYLSHYLKRCINSK